MTDGGTTVVGGAVVVSAAGIGAAIEPFVSMVKFLKIVATAVWI